MSIDFGAITSCRCGSSIEAGLQSLERPREVRMERVKWLARKDARPWLLLHWGIDVKPRYLVGLAEECSGSLIAIQRVACGDNARRTAPTAEPEPIMVGGGEVDASTLDGIVARQFSTVTLMSGLPLDLARDTKMTVITIARGHNTCNRCAHDAIHA
jgi:hypothetical protein